MDLLALALRRDWKGIEKILTTKGVLGIGKKKKSPIGFERVVRLLGQGRYRATDDVRHDLISFYSLKKRWGGGEMKTGGFFLTFHCYSGVAIFSLG